MARAAVKGVEIIPRFPAGRAGPVKMQDFSTS
jgi:hypothetical protein